MRKFNLREKAFLKILEEISNSDLEFLGFFMNKKYFTKDKNSLLIIIPQKTKALLYIKKEVFDDLALRKLEIKKFIEILSLIEYLKQIRLIDIIPNPQAQNFAMHIMYEDFDSPYQTSPSLDIILNAKKSYLKMADLKIYSSNNEVLFEAVELEKHTYDIIMQNLMGLLFVSEELNVFVKRGFKSTEDVRYKYGQLATWISIFIAFAFGVLGLFYSQSVDKVKRINIDNYQLDSILQNQEELNERATRILKILEQNSTKDTLDERF